jgi:uncharacterized protein YndB with AHSA1/START domain
MAEKQRGFEVTIDIEAPAAEVWKALTQAEELVRWFPLQAEVKPGKGGTVLWTWGDAWRWENRIDAWDPPRLLRLVQDESRGYDAEGRPLPPGKVEPARIAVEFTLESRGGKTLLKLVHSGFGRGTDWDDEYDATNAGWQYELRSLRHYLMRHRGRDRRVGHAHVSTDLPLASAWEKLLGPGGFEIPEAARKAGGPYAVALPTGGRLTGEVQLYIPGRDFSGTARETDEGLFRLSAFRAGGKTGVTAWLSTYAADKAPRVAEFQRSSEKLLRGLFR